MRTTLSSRKYRGSSTTRLGDSSAGGSPIETVNSDSSKRKDKEYNPIQPQQQAKAQSQAPHVINHARLMWILLVLLVSGYFFHRCFAEEHTGPVQSKLKASSAAVLRLEQTDVSKDAEATMPTKLPKDTSSSLSSAVDTKIKLKHRVLTIVLPSVVNPDGRRKRLEMIAKTWGPASHAIFVLHNEKKEYPSRPTQPDQFPQVLIVPPNITFDDGLPRLYHVIREAYAQWDSDFYFFANDHTYVIPEHLCYYLQDQDPDTKMYAGHALKNEREAFNSGAAGYILSRSTMRSLIERFDAEDENCITKGNNWLQGNPGLVTAKCLHHSLDTKAIDTRESGKFHRFHAYGLVRIVMGKVDQWYINKHEKLRDISGFDESYSTLLKGADCCSSQTISFHYVEYKENLAMFKIREDLLKRNMTDAEVQNKILRLWPTVWKDLGGYSRLLPDPNVDRESWAAFIAIFRKISMAEYQNEC